FGVALTLAHIVELGKGRNLPARMVRLAVIGARRPDELQNLLRHAMHIDGERNAAIADKREPEFLFLHAAMPVSAIDRESLNLVSIV
ncbi:hypothetical protein DBT52_09470, partial [Aerococcus mictus]